MEGTPYPTLPMHDMMNERNRLEQMDPELGREAIKAFQDKHLVKTGLQSGEGMQMVVTLFRIHAETVREAVGFKEKMAELPNLVRYAKESLKNIIAFYCQLVDRLTAGQTVFYVVLGDGKTAIPVDLCETEAQYRCITVTECGGCRKKDVPLLQCTVCKKAAYCNRECQKMDIKFHRRFCSQFAGTTAMAKETNK